MAKCSYFFTGLENGQPKEIDCILEAGHPGVHRFGDSQPTPELEVTCPHCGKTIKHKIVDLLKAAGEALGNAIGEAKFGG